jgi:hypothetical protein
VFFRAAVILSRKPGLHTARFDYLSRDNSEVTLRRGMREHDYLRLLLQSLAADQHLFTLDPMPLSQDEIQKRTKLWDNLAGDSEDGNFGDILDTIAILQPSIEEFSPGYERGVFVEKAAKLPCKPSPADYTLSLQSVEAIIPLILLLQKARFQKDATRDHLVKDCTRQYQQVNSELHQTTDCLVESFKGLDNQLSTAKVLQNAVSNRTE